MLMLFLVSKCVNKKESERDMDYLNRYHEILQKVMR